MQVWPGAGRARVTRQPDNVPSLDPLPVRHHRFRQVQVVRSPVIEIMPIWVFHAAATCFSKSTVVLGV